MIYVNPRRQFSAFSGDRTAILNRLNNSPFEFHLTGSYFFGCETPESDIDFITQDSENVIAYLTDIGFERMGGEQGRDYDTLSETLDVYELGNVQVQVVKDAAIKCLARDILSTHFSDLHRETRGVHRDEMWNEAVRLARLIRQFAENYKNGVEPHPVETITFDGEPLLF